ncbi:hypothetical protein NKDENANG_02471 [Candidatus Entotheonellaceae bacterium PAL068K]
MGQDPLHTPHPASLYDTVAPEKAPSLLERCEFHHTSRHGSWLNMATSSAARFRVSAWRDALQIKRGSKPTSPLGKGGAIKLTRP